MKQKSSSLRPIQKLDQLEEVIETDESISMEDISTYKKQLFHLEKHFVSDDNINGWNRINRLHKYLQHLQENHNSIKSSILTIIATVFLPLGVIVGYFGMNFQSMGVPSLKHGIFTKKNAQHYVLMLCFISTLVVLLFFYFMDHLKMELYD